MLKKGAQKALQLFYSASLALETIPLDLTNVREALYLDQTKITLCMNFILITFYQVNIMHAYIRH